LARSRCTSASSTSSSSVCILAVTLTHNQTTLPSEPPLPIRVQTWVELNHPTVVPTPAGAHGRRLRGGSTPLGSTGSPDLSRRRLEGGINDHVGFTVSDYAQQGVLRRLAPLGLAVLLEPVGEAAGFGRDGKPSSGSRREGRRSSGDSRRVRGRRSQDRRCLPRRARSGRDGQQTPGVRALYHPHYYGAYVRPGRPQHRGRLPPTAYAGDALATNSVRACGPSRTAVSCSSRARRCSASSADRRAQIIASRSRMVSAMSGRFCSCRPRGSRRCRRNRRGAEGRRADGRRGRRRSGGESRSAREEATINMSDPAARPTCSMERRGGRQVSRWLCLSGVCLGLRILSRVAPGSSSGCHRAERRRS
jgi:hypothetical protein